MCRIVLRLLHKRHFCIRAYNDNVRVRFAPSPTGFLHLGGLRTALYNYIFAKSNNGKLILRIEDTDQTRLVQGATEQLKKDLEWCGIEIHEGPGIGGSYGPYIQSQRLNIYKTQVQYLLQNESAYYCFCTDKRLNLLRREALKVQQIPRYDNKCRHLSKDEVKKRLASGQPSCIRFKLNENDASFDDLIYGKITYNVSLNEGDPVIIKSDGYPTYHFANVVDDHFMNITHVLRGVEWQISTTKHIFLYRAFNWTPPKFGHLPLLMNADGTKLSKRQGDIQIGHYREDHIFPLALINFIISSGGGFEKDSDQFLRNSQIFTIEELCSQFNICRINPHSGKLSSERLLELNRLELKRQLQQNETEMKLVKEVRDMLKNNYPERYKDSCLDLSEDHIKNILHWSVDRISKLSDLVSNNLEFLWIIPPSDNKAIKYLDEVKEFKTQLETEEIEDKEKIGRFLKQFAIENGIKYSAFMKTLRSILSGLQDGPGVAEMIEILGKENTLKRLEMFISNNTKFLDK